MVISRDHGVKSDSIWKESIKRKKIAYREKDISKCGNDATAETYNKTAIGHQHELGCCSSCNASSKCGVLDVNLRNKCRKMCILGK